MESSTKWCWEPFICRKISIFMLSMVLVLITKPSWYWHKADLLLWWTRMWYASQYSSVWWHYSILPAKFYASFRYAKWRAVHCWSSQRKISIFAWLAWFLVSWQEQFGKELNLSWRLWLRSGLSCCVLCKHAHYFYFFLTANVCLQQPERQM